MSISCNHVSSTVQYGEFRKSTNKCNCTRVWLLIEYNFTTGVHENLWHDIKYDNTNEK